jgi:predicted HTH domain antitoxin
MGVTLNIPDSVVQGLRIPEGEIVKRLRTELAVALYAQGVLSLGKAAELAEMNRMLFGEMVGQRGSPGIMATWNSRKTSSMLVASNTSPISNLAIIGRLDLQR